MIQRTPAHTLPLALMLLAFVQAFSAPAARAQDGPSGQQYVLDSVVPISEAVVHGAEWVDNEHYITLEISSAGAVVRRTGFDLPIRSEFLSADFMADYVCPPAETGSLSWTVSPGRNFIFFNWKDDAQHSHWSLMDVSEAPQVRLKRFPPPPGMEIDDVLFSPDDQYAVLVHDEMVEGSPASVLVMDMRSGQEVWRIASGQLNFVEKMWWSGVIFSAPKFNALVSLFDRKFSDDPVLAVCDIGSQSIEESADSEGLLMGSDALWGKVTAHNLGGYRLIANIPGQSARKVIELSNQPKRIKALPNPGLVLVCNSLDTGRDALWLVNVLDGSKTQISDDCASFSVSLDSKLLVRSQSSNELRFYVLR